MSEKTNTPDPAQTPDLKIKRKRGNKLEQWEVAIIKAMLARGHYADQDIQAYFTRPMRTVNHRAFGEIRTGKKHKLVKSVSDEELDAFLLAWPELDPDTGLSLRGDELLIKAREAMIAAVHTFNGAGLTFRAELFIVTSVIAWTYLLHAWFKREGIDYRYKPKDKQESDRYWNLRMCLKEPRCPVSEGAKSNLKFLLEIRDEIEHRTTSRIDDEIGDKLQAWCINFNDVLKSAFGPQYGLEKRLPIALQFVSFGDDQRMRLKRAADIPAHISTFISAFEHELTEEQLSNPTYQYRVSFVPITKNRLSGADHTIEFIKMDSADAKEGDRVILKEKNKNRYLPSKVVQIAKDKGYSRFNLHYHTKLWKELNARKVKCYGCHGDHKGTWIWFDSWIKVVLKHCEENAEKYKPKQ
ncbi:MAG: DUF3644 domain-containing protein [Rhodobacteraceae bacterium]|nr:DUF3644 domain-containing protein [Paracoccaceae bacterium]